MRTTEKLLQSHGSVAWAGGQDLRVLNNNPGCRSWNLSVFFRTTVSLLQYYPIIQIIFI